MNGPSVGRTAGHPNQRKHAVVRLEGERGGGGEEILQMINQVIDKSATPVQAHCLLPPTASGPINHPFLTLLASFIFLFTAMGHATTRAGISSLFTYFSFVVEYYGSSCEFSNTMVRCSTSKLSKTVLTSLNAQNTQVKLIPHTGKVLRFLRCRMSSLMIRLFNVSTRNNRGFT